MTDLPLATREDDDLHYQENYSEKELSEEDLKKNLDKIGLMLAEKRSKAIQHREESGMENIWREDDDHYEGIDYTSRADTTETKPWGRADVRSGETHGSDIFFNITRPYVDASDARVGDMLLPTADRSWTLDPTPIPELAQIAEGKIPQKVNSQIDSSFQQQVDDGDMDMEGATTAALKTRTELVDQVAAEMQEARDKAKMAEKQIADWHVECQYITEMRLVIHDAAKLGTGVLKGPVPQRKRSIAYVDGELQVNEETVPVSIRVDPWNCYPDSGCGENIHKGSDFFERDFIGEKLLQEMAKGEDYNEKEVGEAILEGPHRAIQKFEDAGSGRDNKVGLDEQQKMDLFEIWHYYGRLSKEDMTGIGMDTPEDALSYVDVAITMVNNRVIRAIKNPLDSGEIPYDFMVWQRMAGRPWGIGVSRQIRNPQRVVNGAARNMMDNAGMAAGPMWIFLQGLVTPIDGRLEIAPRKGWQAGEDADLNDVDKAFRFVQMDMMTDDLKLIMDIALKMAEDVTGMPLILQGQQGSAPETVGGMQLLHNNASTVMRRIARLFDDMITEPHIRRYYEFLLMYGEDEMKGDFEIKAHGSAGLLQRDADNQFIQSMGELVLEPKFGLDPHKWMEEHLKGQKFDPARFQYDDEEWKKVVEQMSQPAPDSSVEVAQIKAEGEMGKEQLRAELAQAKLAQELELANKEIEFNSIMKQVDAELGELDREGHEAEVLQKIKASLTEMVMKLTTQKQLAGQSPQVTTPAVEPMGRAAPGQAFVE